MDMVGGKGGLTRALADLPVLLLLLWFCAHTIGRLQTYAFGYSSSFVSTVKLFRRT